MDSSAPRCENANHFEGGLLIGGRQHEVSQLTRRGCTQRREFSKFILEVVPGRARCQICDGSDPTSTQSWSPRLHLKPHTIWWVAGLSGFVVDVDAWSRDRPSSDRSQRVLTIHIGERVMTGAVHDLGGISQQLLSPWSRLSIDSQVEAVQVPRRHSCRSRHVLDGGTHSVLEQLQTIPHSHEPPAVLAAHARRIKAHEDIVQVG